MAAFTSISPDRIVTQTSISGLTETGDPMRFDLIETTKHLIIQRYEAGVGISTTTFLIAARTRAEATFAAATATLAQVDLTEAAPVEAAPVAVAEPVVEAVEVTEPVVEAEPTGQPARARGPNRPDAETEVWRECDLAVVMVQGRTYRYDLRRGADTIESLPATRNWREERQTLIQRGARLLRFLPA